MSAEYSNSARETSGEDARTTQKDAGPAEEDTGPAAEGHPKPQKDTGPDEEDTRSRRRTPDPARPPMDAAQDTKTVSKKKDLGQL